MPVYCFRCADCDHEFEELLKISERKRPEVEPCPSCELQGRVELIVQSPRIVSGVGDFQAKVSNNFKDRLKEIHKAAGRHSKMELA